MILMYCPEGAKDHSRQALGRTYLRHDSKTRSNTLNRSGQFLMWKRVVCWISTAMMISLFADDICAAFFPNPDFVPPTCIHVHSCSWAKRLFCRLRVIRVCYSELAAQNQMGREARVCVGRVICVSCTIDQRLSMVQWHWAHVRSIGPGEDMREAPRGDVALSIRTRLHRCTRPLVDTRRCGHP